MAKASTKTRTGRAAPANPAAGEMPPATNTLPSEEVAPAAEDGTNPPSASQPVAQGEAQDTQGAPMGDGGKEPSGSEPSEPDAPATAAAAGEDQVLPEPAPSTEKTAGESGKAPGAAAAVAPEPASTSRLEFQVVSPIELDGRRYEPGSPVLLTRTVHAELRSARAISGDWPSE